ncbi:alpha-1A adrenergic receptor-like [Amphiura filiformis]|uniref:alpha-1A adrenergic receptor-like n=1 Tax=Amphiura filiformis TaxID=82378 RepID=UPI003B217050
MLHVLLIAIDRYIAITFPLRYLSIITPNTITTLTISTWALALFCGLLPTFGWRKPAEDLEYCNADQVVPLSYYAFFFLVSFLIPLGMTLGFYWKIIVIARSQVRRIGEMRIFVTRRRVIRDGDDTPVGDSPRNLELDINPEMNSSDNRNSSVAIVKAVKTAAIVSGVFVICWLPSFTFRFVMEYLNYKSDETIRAPIVEVFTKFLAFANSAANPIVYSFRYRDFRRILKKIVK